jgi:D-sedoheptulose 7-phosphate isomerase
LYGLRKEEKALEIIRRYLDQVQHVLAELPMERVCEMVDVLLSANYVGSTVFVVGNGGSAATASHFAGDLAKGTITPGRPRFRVMALTDNVPLMTAWSNDFGYEDIFAEQLRSVIRRGDVLVAISGSGNSKNVLHAVDLASQVGGITVGLSGFAGGKLSTLVDVPVIVPCDCMEQIEDVHLTLCHLACSVLRERMRQTEPPILMMLDTSLPKMERLPEWLPSTHAPGGNGSRT